MAPSSALRRNTAADFLFSSFLSFLFRFIVRFFQLAKEKEVRKILFSSKNGVLRPKPIVEGLETYREELIPRDVLGP